MNSCPVHPCRVPFCPPPAPPSTETRRLRGLRINFDHVQGSARSEASQFGGGSDDGSLPQGTLRRKTCDTPVDAMAPEHLSREGAGCGRGHAGIGP